MKDYIELGSSPYDEDCVQVTDKADYIGDMKKEIRQYIQLLEEKFTNLPSGVRFSAKSFPHDFGTYYEVVVYYDDENDQQTSAAYFIESNLPATWADTASFDVEKSIENENIEDDTQENKIRISKKQKINRLIKNSMKKISEYQRNLTITNPTGLHARPASNVVQNAQKSPSKVTILFNNKTINAKSMMSLLSAGIKNGSEITISADGEGEKEIVDLLYNLISQFKD